MIVMTSELRELIDSFLSFFRTNEESVLPLIGLSPYDVTDMADLVRLELSRFAMYLSCSDGEISWSEANAINEYLDYDFSPDEIRYLVEETNTYSSEFENTVPICIQCAVAVDNNFHENGLHFDNRLSEIGVTIFRALAHEISISDFDLSDSELDDTTHYIAMLEKYLDENLFDREHVPAPPKKVSVKVSKKRVPTKAPEKK